MSARDRHQQILAILEERKAADIHFLREVLNVSEPTIRNDLRLLESQGKLQRSHGGALQVPRVAETPYDERHRIRLREKRAIGAAAIELIQDGDTVFLDAGSTIMAMAEQLPANLQFNAVTAGLHIALEASRRPGVSVHVVGGLVRPSLQELIGPKALQSIRDVHAHKVFLSVSGVDADKGLTDNHVFSAEVKRAMVRSSDRVIVLADSSKFGRSFYAPIVPLDQVDTVITDDGLDEMQERRLRAFGVTVIQAPVVALASDQR